MASLPARAPSLVRAAGVVLAAAGMAAWTLPAAAADEAGRITAYDATVEVRADGTLHVVEEVTYDFAGRPTGDVARSLTTREHYDAEYDRTYDVSDVTVESTGTDTDPSISSDDGDTTTITVDFAEPQDGSLTVTYEYDVEGAVAETADGIEVRWPVVQGFDRPIDDITIQWNVPDVLWIACLAGSPGSSRPCTTAQTAETPNPVMTQMGLEPGQQVVGVLGLEEGADVATTADLDQRWSIGRAFSATGVPLAVALGVLSLGLLGALALWWLRGRDVSTAKVPAVSPFLPRDGRVVFAPPGAVRPGQMGTLVDEHADVIDVSSTVIDLAVRNYLFVEELPHGEFGRHDWVLHRRHRGGDELLGYEREVLEAVFSSGEEVRVSELGDSVRDRFAAIRGALYDDVVQQGWFADRPDAVRNRWTTAGWVLVVAGVVLTGVLAIASSFALVGVALVLAGAAWVLAGEATPARTARGSRALDELRHFRDFLATAGLDDVPPEQREEMGSRCLPYALVFGLGERWAVQLAALDADTEPDEPLHWYGAPEHWHLSDAAPSLMHLSTALGGAIAARRLLV